MAIRTEEQLKSRKLSSESISRKRLINILNYVNFKGSSVVVNLRSLADGSMLSLRARRNPAPGKRLVLPGRRHRPGI